MATVYKVQIRTVSAWVNYTPEQIENEIKKLLKDRLDMENIEIKVERVA
jgi:hypothetical protein